MTELEMLRERCKQLEEDLEGWKESRNELARIVGIRQ